MTGHHVQKSVKLGEFIFVKFAYSVGYPVRVQPAVMKMSHLCVDALANPEQEHFVINIFKRVNTGCVLQDDLHGRLE